jgi:5,10-methylene-tetrahydrofolate dehydrogenase/methenyl tetrahydrofolate cyclohydrolase
LSAISVEKDVDGFHPLNMGRLCMKVWGVTLALTADVSGGGGVLMPFVSNHSVQQYAAATAAAAEPVDGLCTQGREPLFVPCTPLGCMELLERTGTVIAGARAVVIGRSNIVGMPAALLLTKRNATVTLCHSATRNMEDAVRQADIVIAAAGQPELIKVWHQLHCPRQDAL